MSSLILRVASNFLLVLTLLFSIWALFRGHNAPGGGFIGGLLAASAFALYLLAYGVSGLKKIIKINLALLLGLGLFASLLSGLISLLYGKAFLEGVWLKTKILYVKIGTPILFDVGVYLVVVASILMIMMALEETE